MVKKIDYNKDNILGWSEEEFIDLQCEMINLKLANNIKCTENEIKLWCNGSGQDWLRKRWGLDKKNIRKQILKDQIEKIQKEIEKLNEKGEN